MNKKILLTFVALATALSLSACGSSNNNKNETVSPSPVTGGETGGTTKDITVKATNWQFDQPDIKLKVGDTVKMTLQNEAGVHGIEIPDLKVTIKSGETATFTVDKAGTFAYKCNIQCGTGHNEMVGNITVS